jgi:hypothetical protein
MARGSPSGHVPAVCASTLALCTAALAAVALLVWPKLFANTPDGVGSLVSAGCEPEQGGEVQPTAPPPPCSARVLLVSPGRYRVEADESYFAWMREVGLPPTSQRASSAALREVLRFTLTYPIYVPHLMLYRSLDYLDLFAPGKSNPVSFPHTPLHHLRAPLVWALLGVITLCLCLGYEARRTLYLAWPLFFNLPIFLFFFSDGPRHVAPALTAQVVAALPPLCEAGFYRTLLGQRWKALALAAAFVAVWFLAHQIDEFVLASDRVRYWAPVLDPARLLSGLPR